MSAIIQILKPFWLSILKYGSIAAGILFVLFKAKQSGKVTAENKQLSKTLNAVQARDKIETNLYNLSDARLDKLYQEHIKRD